MPLDEGIGCLGVVLRALGGALEFAFNWCHTGEFFGFIASWTIRLLTFGRCKPDPESWGMIMLGFVIFAALVIAAGTWGDW